MAKSSEHLFQSRQRRAYNDANDRIAMLGRYLEQKTLRPSPEQTRLFGNEAIRINNLLQLAGALYTPAEAVGPADGIFLPQPISRVTDKPFGNATKNMLSYTQVDPENEYARTTGGFAGVYLDKRAEISGNRKPALFYLLHDSAASLPGDSIQRYTLAHVQPRTSLHLAYDPVDARVFIDDPDIAPGIEFIRACRSAIEQGDEIDCGELNAVAEYLLNRSDYAGVPEFQRFVVQTVRDQFGPADTVWDITVNNAWYLSSDAKHSADAIDEFSASGLTVSVECMEEKSAQKLCLVHYDVNGTGVTFMPLASVTALSPTRAFK